MAKAPRKRKPKKDGPGRLAQFKAAYTMTRKGDPKIGWILLGIFVAVWAAFILLGVLLKTPVFLGIFGLSAALLAAIFVFGRRAERSAYRQMEGQPGAAAQALSTLRRGYTVTPAVGFNKNGDLVHRVVGKCGVVLVAEGAPSRIHHLLLTEKKRHARVLGDIPVHEIEAGDGEGQVPLPKLGRTVMKLPRTVSGAQLTEIEQRLKALSVTQNAMPIPKGPLPKGLKMPKAPS